VENGLDLPGIICRKERSFGSKEEVAKVAKDAAARR
jgi:hypothetical protein